MILLLSSLVLFKYLKPSALSEGTIKLLFSNTANRRLAVRLFSDSCAFMQGLPYPIKSNSCQVMIWCMVEIKITLNTTVSVKIIDDKQINIKVIINAIYMMFIRKNIKKKVIATTFMTLIITKSIAKP